ncbi:MAG: shikimate dehydrogenase [Candidatus Omnitrophota bacterium]
MSLKPKLYGLIGFPIQHSLSPRMHNTAFSRLGINAKYKLFEVKPGCLKYFLNTVVKKEKILGFNVTYPYKEEILDFLNSKSGGVKEIGAANTVLVEKNKLKGFNTDYLGFSAHLKELKVQPKKVAIIGSGGASRAVCLALAKMKIEELAVYDIDQFKSINLFKNLKPVLERIKFKVAASIEELAIYAKDLLVNCSPVGMRQTDPCLVKPEDLGSSLFVYDLIYSPQETKLLSLAKSLNLKFSNGLGMLLYQGAFAFKLFSGKAAPLEAMRMALLKRR